MNKLQEMSNIVMNSVINEWVQGETNRKILRDRHIDCLVIEELSYKYALSDTTIKTILNKYDPIIFKHYDKEMRKTEKAEQAEQKQAENLLKSDLKLAEI